LGNFLHCKFGRTPFIYDELVNYLRPEVEDKSIFIASILQQWRQQQEAEELARAF
jgi:antitoxin ParD1/3/4